MRTPGGYNAVRRGALLTDHSTARTAHTGELQHGAVRYVKAPQQCAVRVQERALQSTEQLGRDRNTRGTGARSAHQHGHSALGAGQ